MLEVARRDLRHQLHYIAATSQNGTSTDMLSSSNARPQQSARRAYVCLRCRLSPPRHHFATARTTTSLTPRLQRTLLSSNSSTTGHYGQPSRVLADTVRGHASAPKFRGTRDDDTQIRKHPANKMVRVHTPRPVDVGPRIAYVEDGVPIQKHPAAEPVPIHKHTVYPGIPIHKETAPVLDPEHRYWRNKTAEKEYKATENAIKRRQKDQARSDFDALLVNHTGAHGARESAVQDAARHAVAQKLAGILDKYDKERSAVAGPQPTTANYGSAPAQSSSNTKRPTLDGKTTTYIPYTGSRMYHKQAQPLTTKTYGGPPPPETPNSFRAKLRRWQEEHGKDMEHLYEAELPGAEEDANGFVNDDFTRPGDTPRMVRRSDEAEDEQQAIAHFARSQAEDLEDDVTDPRFLFMGDLVELEYPSSDKEGMLAVFVRRVGPESQLYTMQGRWVHVAERNIQYAIPGWVSPELVEPLIAYLPDEEQAQNKEALRQNEFVNDISVPRNVAAPLVSRMVAFNRESQEIYRKHASTLDRAHDLLAHKEDLRYGSLVSAAEKLLKTPSDKLPLTALFTVRKALSHAGFAFNVDRRSHRMTGYLQIRSKEQVRMVDEVRGWMRDWQEDLAMHAASSKRQRQRHQPDAGAARIYRFIEHAKSIVTASRQDRQPTLGGNIGPSKVRHEITPDQDSVKTRADFRFNEADQQIIRFLEAWACSNMFMGIPRLHALPPLILQATGLYEDFDLNSQTGFMFLQEIGTILPYENRVRFDQHLLLPSSQHSKPLQTLMTNVVSMKNEPGFMDSMAEIRHDWGNLPVYCIDGASAHEIDDGLSVERATPADSENPELWVHVHIANPTAFFSRDHPLAKMARHMGETIYTPERAYMMLPRWATQRHFSLANDRPCLTFSARMNARGETLEHKIRAGRIRNVHRLTPDETNELVGLKSTSAQNLVNITVGGNAPPAAKRTSAVPRMGQSNIEDLKMLQRLAELRQDVRKAAGGVFFDSHKPEMTVWQNWRNAGLAWDHPHRKGARTVEGDPVINMQTQGLQNWFHAGDGARDILVREMMLLACEISTEWCAKRQIPTIFRGAVAKPGQPDSQEFYNNVCLPAIQKNNGELPLHIGIDYIKTQGSVILSTKPLRHNLLGLNHYGKVTSPLRRYGDMILHWQIEAALREEARTGKSLLAPEGASLSSPLQPDRSFLPFSTPVLQSIMTGLQPREQMITRAKGAAESFWVAMLLFRAHHFGEAKLPFETCHAYIAAQPWNQVGRVACILEELNIATSMRRPERQGLGLPEPRAGDRWECQIEQVDVFNREVRLKPFRLVSRWE